MSASQSRRPGGEVDRVHPPVVGADDRPVRPSITADDMIGPPVLNTQRSFSAAGIRAGATPERPPSPRKIGQLPGVGAERVGGRRGCR